MDQGSEWTGYGEFPRMSQSSAESADDMRDVTEGFSLASTPFSQDQGTGSPATDLADFSDTNQQEKLFFSNLSNYLLFGVLADGDVQSLQLLPTDVNGWEELLSLPKDCQLLTQRAVDSLIAARWIRVFCPLAARQGFGMRPSSTTAFYRVYVLPDDIGRRYIHNRHVKRLRDSLRDILSACDTSSQSWMGDFTQRRLFDQWAITDHQSLAQIFESIPSPCPDLSAIDNVYSRDAMFALLHPEESFGLKSKLYPFQQRSAALMIQREAQPKRFLDPRFEKRLGPSGEVFYYCPRTAKLLRSSQTYQSVPGGILAETMGSGKTLICLATILATKGHWPEVPWIDRWSESITTQRRISPLKDMTARSIARHRIPWKPHFDYLKWMCEEEHTECIKVLQDSPPTYMRNLPGLSYTRGSTRVEGGYEVFLSSATVIVVPANLLQHWKTEIEKHVEPGMLKVLIVDKKSAEIPPLKELLTYDVIIFTRSRFELEYREESEEDRARTSLRTGTYATQRTGRTGHESRLDALTVWDQIHFLRIIVDEGHGFSSADVKAVNVANRVLRADRRWIVSGTPAKELGIGSRAMSSKPKDDNAMDVSDESGAPIPTFGSFDANKEKFGAAVSIGDLVVNFLQVPPWGLYEDQKKVKWQEYIFRHESQTDYTYSGFAECLVKTLEQIVVRTRPQDVFSQIKLPPLTTQVVRLEPCLFDKIIQNLFILVLRANAITSERTDQDYMFHTKNKKWRNDLVRNIRQSNFYWTAFSRENVLHTVDQATRYLAKPEAQCSDRDRRLMEDCMALAIQFIDLTTYEVVSLTHDMGVYVEEWPERSVDHWAFTTHRNPIFTGITPVIQARKHIYSRLGTEDPEEGFSGEGIVAKRDAFLKHQKPSKPVKDRPNNGKGKTIEQTRTGQAGSIREAISTGGTGLGASISVSPTKRTPSGAPRGIARSVSKKDVKAESTNEAATIQRILPEDSGLRNTRLVGTCSAKFTYLLSQVRKFSATEKILIFYDNQDTAFYVSQGIDVLNVEHRVYASTLSAEKRAEYLQLFEADETIRVLIMDINQAAHGLNLPFASRVFFLNPPCRPDVEAQAIARAHRIGQTKPVHVETLILKGTIEEQMFERAQGMTVLEHEKAKQIADDVTIAEIIQNAEPLAIDPKELTDLNAQMARLAEPVAVFEGMKIVGWDHHRQEKKVRPQRKRRIIDSDDEEITYEPKRPRTG